MKTTSTTHPFFTKILSLLVFVSLFSNLNAQTTQCYTSPTNPAVSAKQTWTIDNVAGTVVIKTTFAKTFVDNTYGNNAIGWGSGHTFNNLVGSDHVQLALYDAAGAKKMEMKVDYITASSSVPSGYKTLGVSGGDGKMIVGNSSDVLNVRTSLDSNFNNAGYVLTTNSPATDNNYTPNPMYPAWVFDVWYEVTVKLSAFNGSFGRALITSVHASPSKTGNNTEPVDPGNCDNTPPQKVASIGDFVWVDQNANGKQDSGEPGVAGVVVKLLDAAGTVIATATTNASGLYLFKDIPISACGQYKVQFGTPGQYTWTTKQASGSTVTNNSNADMNGLTDEFTVCPGDFNTCIDAGIRASTAGTATIGDFVFVDQNANGRQDTGEPGVPNVTVKLLNSTGGVVATTTTNSSGIYFFTNVPISTCAQYRVQFGTPGQYTWTAKQAAGSTVTNNSNADMNGFTDFFTVCPGDYNTCIDAGIISNGGPLAISIQFKGTYTNGVANLTWRTGSEVSPATFEVERSADGSNFKTINASVINSKGIQSGSTYNFNDNLPLAGANYYRVKIKENGNYHYSNIINLNVVFKGINITGIYPNPFVNRVKINVVAENAAGITVTVNDYMGRIISTQKIQGQKGSNEIFVENLGSLTKGIYNLQVTTGAQTKTIKLMKD